MRGRRPRQDSADAGCSSLAGLSLLRCGLKCQGDLQVPLCGAAGGPGLFGCLAETEAHLGVPIWCGDRIGQGLMQPAVTMAGPWEPVVRLQEPPFLLLGRVRTREGAGSPESHSRSVALEPAFLLPGWKLWSLSVSTASCPSWGLRGVGWRGWHPAAGRVSAPWE